MKEIKIQIPEGYEGIDEEKSNLSEGKIVFKKKENVAWKDGHHFINGYYISGSAGIMELPPNYTAFSDNPEDNNIFATKKQAKSMLAMAQLSQIIANDERFGGPITDEEWKDEDMAKHVIVRASEEIRRGYFMKHYHFLAFHTLEQRNLFLEENEDLIRQYFMLD